MKQTEIDALGLPTSQQPATASGGRLPGAVRDFLVISALLTIVSAIYTLIMRYKLHWPYPYNWPLFIPWQRYADFTIYQHKFTLFHTTAFFQTDYPFTYPAPMAEIYHLLFFLPGRRALDALLLIALCAFVSATILFIKAANKRGLRLPAAILVGPITLFLSWPAALVLDRANVEIFVWIALAAGMWAFVRKHSYLAAALFGIAASLKLFPVIFLVLFLRREKLRSLVTGIAVFGAVTVCSLFLLGPTAAQAYHGVNYGLRFFHDEYMVVYLREVTGFDHSIMGLLKTGIMLVKPSASASWIPRVSRFYMPLMALLGTVLYFARIRKLPALNQILILTIISILFTPFSGDGTLLHLYFSLAPCMFLAVEAQRRGTPMQGLRPIFWCFAYLLSFESFWIHHGVRFEAQLKCVALIALLWLALRYPLGAAELDTTSRSMREAVHE